MAFFTVSSKEDQISDSSSSNYIGTSGIYDVIVKRVIVSTAKSGAVSLDFWFNYQDQDQMIYSAFYIKDKQGNPMFSAKLLNKLAIVNGATEGMEIGEPEPETLPIGKGGEQKEVYVLHEFDDTPVAIRIQFEYSIYEGQIRENKTIKNFFRVPDHATASEIVNKSPSGKQYERELTDASKVVYKDDLTEEDIKEWKKNRGMKPVEEEKKTSTFGQKRSFGK